MISPLLCAISVSKMYISNIDVRYDPTVLGHMCTRRKDRQCTIRASLSDSFPLTTTFQACTSDSCICTNSFAAQYDTCIDCILNIGGPPSAAVQQEFQGMLDRMQSSDFFNTPPDHLRNRTNTQRSPKSVRLKASPSAR